MTNKTQRDAAVERIENNTAIVLDGRDSLRRVWLFLRALERRRVIDSADAAAAQNDMERIQRALDAQLAQLQEQRQNPLGEWGATNGV